jgi:hypothetical protein
MTFITMANCDTQQNQNAPRRPIPRAGGLGKKVIVLMI